MEIVQATKAGFCFGVKRAIHMAKAIRKSSKEPVYVLGHLVHNEYVVSELEREGIHLVESLEEVKGKIVLVTAHGLDYKIIEQAKALGLTVVDTTCPVVQKVHKTAQKFKREGSVVVLIGHKEHIEVQGTSASVDQDIQIVEGADQMRGETPQQLPLSERLTDQGEVEELKVAETAVDEL